MGKRKKPLMTEEEKRARRHARKADAINEKRRAAAGPLFADQAELVSADDMRRLWFANVAGGVENMHAQEFPQGKPMAKFQERRLRELAASVLGREVVEKLDAYRMRTYPGPGEAYGKVFWYKVLTTTERIVFEYERVEYDPPQQFAKKVLDKSVWPPPGYVPPFTRAQLVAFEEVGTIPQERPSVDPLGLG